MTDDMMQLAMAAPMVIAQRVTRMALAGGSPSASDRREMDRMSTEKVAAFAETWSTAATRMTRANMDLGFDLMRVGWSPWNRVGGLVSAATARFGEVATDTIQQCLGPVRRRAVANAKRLGRKGRA